MIHTCDGAFWCPWDMYMDATAGAGEAGRIRTGVLAILETARDYLCATTSPGWDPSPAGHARGVRALSVMIPHALSKAGGTPGGVFCRCLWPELACLALGRSEAAEMDGRQE